MAVLCTTVRAEVYETGSIQREGIHAILPPTVLDRKLNRGQHSYGP